MKKVSSKTSVNVKLSSGFDVVQKYTMPALLLVTFLPMISPGHFPWITNFTLYKEIIFLALGYQILLTILVNVLKGGWFWNYAGYGWVIFYIAFIYVTGSLDSSFIFTLLFIPVVSVSQLDPKLTRNTGIFAIFLFAMLIFTDQKYLSADYIIKHFLQVFLIGLITFYIHKFIREILSEKYEKEQLKRRFIELSELDQVKQMFLTAMSHQLRTPLSGAKWALGSVLEKGECSDREILEESYKKINASINIIGEMLKTAEFDIGQGRIKIKKESINLTELIKKITDSLIYMTKTNGSKLELDLGVDIIFVQADKKMLDLALTNIVDNAFRYSPGGIVHVYARRERDDIKIVVKDNGIGIETSDLEYIFQKFYRGKNAMSIDPNESGVGLYATKKIIEMHGGTIKLSSLIGKGTQVDIVLPVV